MPCEQRRILELEAEKKRKAAAKKRKEKEKARKEKEAREARERVEAARNAIRNQAKKLGWRLVETQPNKFVASKPQSNDKINLEVLAGGIIKTITDVISMANHSNAEAFLRNIATTLKGSWKIFHRHPAMHGTGASAMDTAAHGHVHGHTH